MYHPVDTVNASGAPVDCFRVSYFRGLFYYFRRSTEPLDDAFCTSIRCIIGRYVWREIIIWVYDRFFSGRRRVYTSRTLKTVPGKHIPREHNVQSVKCTARCKNIQKKGSLRTKRTKKIIHPRNEILKGSDCAALPILPLISG